MLSGKNSTIFHGARSGRPEGSRPSPEAAAAARNRPSAGRILQDPRPACRSTQEAPAAGAGNGSGAWRDGPASRPAPNGSARESATARAHQAEPAPGGKARNRTAAGRLPLPSTSRLIDGPAGGRDAGRDAGTAPNPAKNRPKYALTFLLHIYTEMLYILSFSTVVETGPKRRPQRQKRGKNKAGTGKSGRIGRIRRGQRGKPAAGKHGPAARRRGGKTRTARTPPALRGRVQRIRCRRPGRTRSTAPPTARRLRRKGRSLPGITPGGGPGRRRPYRALPAPQAPPPRTGSSWTARRPGAPETAYGTFLHTVHTLGGIWRRVMECIHY